MTGNVIGLCDQCGYPVRAGEERIVTVHQNTGPGRDVLLHEKRCAPTTPRPRR